MLEEHAESRAPICPDLPSSRLQAARLTVNRDLPWNATGMPRRIHPCGADAGDPRMAVPDAPPLSYNDTGRSSCRVTSRIKPVLRAVQERAFCGRQSQAGVRGTSCRYRRICTLPFLWLTPRPNPSLLLPLRLWLRANHVLENSGDCFCG